MKHKCDGCQYKGQHEEMMFSPFGVCLKFHNLWEAEKAYKADKCPFIKTNFDRIKAMSVEEMAECINRFLIVGGNCERYCAYTKDGRCNKFDNDGKGGCVDGIRLWLESEVQGE